MCLKNVLFKIYAFYAFILINIFEFFLNHLNEFLFWYGWTITQHSLFSPSQMFCTVIAIPTDTIEV